jgi:hypothetical protein
MCSDREAANDFLARQSGKKNLSLPSIFRKLPAEPFACLSE